MSYDSLLIHTCDVSSYSEGDRDAYGNKVKTWTVVHESTPCRLVSTIGREVRFGAEVVISDYKLFVEDSVDITEHDRVSNILLASTGAVVDASTFEVLLVQRRTNGASQHHREVYLQKVA